MDEKEIPNLNQLPGDERNEMKSSKKIIPIILIILMIGAGIFTGYLISGKKRSSSISSGGEIPKGQLVKGKEFGAKDTSSFKDTAMGVVEQNSAGGEGTHRLIREGGPSQTVYMISSVLDLDQFVGLKIQVWGETFKGQKAGWLMDIGRVKILE